VPTLRFRVLHRCVDEYIVDLLQNGKQVGGADRAGQNARRPGDRLLTPPQGVPDFLQGLFGHTRL